MYIMYMYLLCVTRVNDDVVIHLNRFVFHELLNKQITINFKN